VIITADAGYRRGAPSMLKPNVDLALAGCPSVEHVVVVDRCGTEVDMVEGRDHWWHDVMADADPRLPGRAHGQPSSCSTCSTPRAPPPSPRASCTPRAATSPRWRSPTRYVFDLRPDTDVYWCAADIGWVTGHSYIVYGPLANGATSVIYEGTPDTPRCGRGPQLLWDIIERYGVTQLYTAPTAIRTFMKWGAEEVERHDLSSLRVLGTVGEPINPEAWMWYHRHIGGERCPIVDTWWQTETGGHMITPLPGVTTTKPGSATFPIPGVFAEVVDDAGNPSSRGGGYLTITRPVAVDAARHLGRPRALPRHLLEHASRAATSPATAPRSTTTATCGCSGGSTT
jgi:acetyl-CoA synthetase